jgi:hypothetical protein
MSSPRNNPTAHSIERVISVRPARFVSTALGTPLLRAMVWITIFGHFFGRTTK